jgi:peptide/nickel transport system substrate-binding protein
MEEKMLTKHQKWMTFFALILVFSLALGACRPAATPAPQPTSPPSQPAQPTQGQPAQVQPTQAPETPPTTADGPKVGGRFVWAVTVEPSSLDAQKTAESIADTVLQFIGAALVAKDPDNNYVPWVAESWDTSEDGLTWTFKLRHDIKFQDGTPLTANDYVWSINRALDPATQSPVTSQILAQVTQVEAPDDYTLVMTLNEPYAPFLDNLTSPGYLQPLSQAWVEKHGDDYARNPMSIGPYTLKEWMTGSHIILERNPDYTWQPAFVKHQGPYYIQEIEFRIIPELATIVAGLEAGEIDYYAGVDPQQVNRIQDTGIYEILNFYSTGALPYVTFNVSKPPFDDLKVRQAFNSAIDRQAMIDVIVKGNGKIQYGPITPATIGYWPGVEDIGYNYDLEKAKSLLLEAGYADANGDGILDKDGQPFTVPFTTLSVWTREAEMIKEMLKAVGVDLDIQQMENAVMIGNVVGGNYQVSMFGFGWPNYDILWMTFNSKQEGILNLAHNNDPELDGYLDAMRTEIDLSKHEEAVNKAQQRIVEQAYMAPLYYQTYFAPMHKKVKGAILSPNNNALYLEDAWIEE